MRHTRLEDDLRKHAIAVKEVFKLVFGNTIIGHVELASKRDWMIVALPCPFPVS